MRPVRLIVTTVLLVLVGAIAYLLFIPGATDFLDSTAMVTNQDEIDQSVLAWVGPPYVDDYQTLRVTGHVDNRLESEIRAATLEIQLFNQSGDKKETITRVVKGIGPLSRKPFDINAGTIGEERTAEISVVKLEVVQ